ncbi:ABC transporter substrate-binding protein [Phenylobacterium sp.]|uniref:ABC transporter substrate-binding protein n=1 Tax=Phenylobacterium sp. TaxID=1871053 RepID=UPI00273111DF|nr:ABC transporter substrate-binding protein [Phenylobacterium sp.]MDP1619248.1 ABC transporter substrate-binding protein [Phenylobacterium sp.]MDP1985758.1 ABC transporter substrate-binding protein [Phenylobacterium sp.]
MIRGIDRRLALAGGLSLVAGCGSTAGPPSRAPAWGRPARVVSLNPCLDVILVEVADRAQIGALSHYARDDYGSTIADIARTLPFTYESAEEVIALRPDLVLTGRHSSLATRNALARLDIPTALFGVPNTVEESLEQVREVARLVGHPQRGERLIGRIERALAAAAPAPQAERLSALVFMPGGFASGPGTLMDEMMTRMGLINAASRYGLRRSMNVPLELVIADPPDVLLAGEPYPGAPSWAERVMEHPALARVAGDMRRAVFPERLLFCGGPVLIQTAAVLARARDAALGRAA